MKPIFNHALWWAAAAVVLLAGCTKDPSVGISGEGMYISLSVDGHALSANTNASNAARRTSANASTRATAVDENVVNDLWVLQFQQNSPSDAPLLRKRYIASVTDPSKVGYAPVLGSKMTLILLANTGDPTLFDATPEGNSSLEELDVLLLAHVLNVTAATGQNYPTDASANLPMLGMTENLMTFPMQEEALPVSLMRSATKVVLTVKNPCAADYPQVTVSSVQLRNVPKIGMFIPAGPEWKIDGTTDAYRYPTADAANFMDYTALTGAVDAAGTTTTVYMAPNARGKGTNTDPRLKSDATAPSGQGPYCTYVEILGTAKASATAPAVDVRYRLYPGEDNTASFNLFANRAYKVDIEITGVNPNDARMTIATDRFDLGVNGPDGDHSGDVGGWGEPHVGDYYYSDGTFSTTLDNSKTAVGIVFWVENGSHFKVAAMSNAGGLAAMFHWAPSNTFEIGTVAASETEQTPAVLSGKYCYDKAVAYAEQNNGDFATVFPAFNACATYNTGDGTGNWYLPAIGELFSLHNVQKAFTAVPTGWSDMSTGTYWSGTERNSDPNTYAWVVDADNDMLDGNTKYYTNHGSTGQSVRCIREIGTLDPKVGDYCYADGSWSTALASGKTPIGMIFWIHPSDPRNFKIQSLDEPPANWNGGTNAVGKLAWSTETVATNATDVDDGMKNMATIRALNPGLAKYPAFEWCHRKDMGDQSGWYLPAKSELQYLWCAFNGKAPIKWDSGYNAEAPMVLSAQSAWNGRLSASGGVNLNDTGVHSTATEYDNQSYWHMLFGYEQVGYSFYTKLQNKGSIRCIREFPTPPRVPAVGDFYYSDGTYSAGLDTSKKTTGMIFWVDPANPKRFKVFALRMDGAGQLWAASDDYVVGPAAQSMDDGRANSDAIRAYFEANKGGIVSETTFAAAFPAAAYCYNDRGETDTDPVGTWYLPALNELEYMYCAYNGALPTLWGVGATSITSNTDAQTVCDNWLQAAAKANTGRTMDSYFDPAIHYTSTENSSDTRYAWGVDFQNGNAEDSYDHKDYFTPWVRCIREVK